MSTVNSVRSRMSIPPVTASTHTSSVDIERLLRKHSFSSVPILGDDGQLEGIVSSTDLIRAPANEARVAKQIMSSPVIIAGPDEPIDTAAWRMTAARVHRIVVTEGELVLGVLSARDILEEVMTRRIGAPIGAVMSTPVESVALGDSIAEALQKLAASNVHGLVVLDGTMPVGVFTHAEALASRQLAPDLQKQPVEEMMSYETLCLDVSTPIHRAAAYCVAMNARRILVVKDKYLAGIISLVDLVSVLARATE